MGVHVVQSAENIWDISQGYGVTISELAAVNGLQNVNALVPGLALYIPRRISPSRLYRIQPGDSLSKVAVQFNTTMQKIMEANPNVDPNVVRVGQIITVPTMEKMQMETLGFIAPYSQQEFLPILSALANQLKYLAIAAYSFTAQGHVYVNLEDRDIVTVSNQLGVIPLLMVRNLIDSEFSAELVGRVLENAQYRRNLVLSLVNIVQQRGYKGVSIDFEFIPPPRRNDFLTFLEELKNALGNLILHVNVHAKTEDIPENPIIGAYDYRRIGHIADVVAVMTIDYGYPGGPPDPVSPAWWVDQVIGYASAQINTSKLQISMPLYGYDKSVSSNATNALSVLSAQNLAISNWLPIQYDSYAESPFFSYRLDNQDEHIVWFEDIRSYIVKYRLVDLYQLSGVTYWQLSQLAPQNWAFVRDNIRIMK